MSSEDNSHANLRGLPMKINWLVTNMQSVNTGHRHCHSCDLRQCLAAAVSGEDLMKTQNPGSVSMLCSLTYPQSPNIICKTTATVSRVTLHLNGQNSTLETTSLDSSCPQVTSNQGNPPSKAAHLQISWPWWAYGSSVIAPVRVCVCACTCAYV